MDYNKIFYENEEQYEEINNELLEQCIKTFLEASKIYFFYEKESLYQDFISLKYYVYTCFPEKIELFYQTLQHFGYNIKNDIISEMVTLGYYSRKKLSRTILERALQSPYISGIQAENQRLTIYTTLGKYQFQNVENYYKKNLKALQYLTRKRNHLRGYCHNRSWEFIDYLDSDTTLMTLSCPYLFQGQYYHTVLKDPSNRIIDLARGIVYEEKVQKELFQGKIIYEAQKDQLQAQLEEALAFFQDDTIKEKYSNPLILTLYREAKR